MNKPQWITGIVAVLLVIVLFSVTQKNLFGPPKAKQKSAATTSSTIEPGIFDSLITNAKKGLTPEQEVRINSLEHSISRGDVKEQRFDIYRQLASFWGDTMRNLPLAMYYDAETARLENSEKSLTFAAQLFLDKLKDEPSPEIRGWEASQSKDLFERSLKLNPENDSAKVGLGAAMLYGGLSMPMEAIGKIKAVADKDSNNIYAQMTLGEASWMSGQYQKALDRFSRVARNQPHNLEAIFKAAEACEQLGKKKEAAEWYARLLPHIDNAEMKKEVEARIALLNK